MCLIIVQPKGHHFSDEELADFWAHSPDGFGYMYRDKSGVHGAKCVGSMGQIIEVYRKHAAGLACVLHFRMATHGEVSIAMAHPFAVSSELLVVHNGIIPGYGRGSESDTAAFVREELIPLVGTEADDLQDERMQEYIAELAGMSNSLVFMDYKGRITKIGRRGLEHGGCWYSNTYAWTAPFNVDEDELEDEPWRRF